MTPRSGAARRAPMLLLLGVAAVAFFLFGPKLPRDQSVRFLLGDRAALVRELTVRYRAAAGGKGGESRDLTDEVLREVSFRYPKGDAPRLVRHEPRLADGDYVLEIDLVTYESRATLRRTVGLFGGPATVDLADAVSAAAPDAGGAR